MQNTSAARTDEDTEIMCFFLHIWGFSNLVGRYRLQLHTHDIVYADSSIFRHNLYKFDNFLATKLGRHSYQIFIPDSKALKLHLFMSRN